MGGLRLGEYKKAKINKVLEQLERDYPKAARRVLNDACNDLSNMYHTLIEQFYRYETKRYIRHWEITAGSREGTNLYYGINFKKDYYHKDPKFFVKISSDNPEMADDYKFNTAQEVLDSVMSGIRFPWDITYVVVGGKMKRQPKSRGPMKIDLDIFNYNGMFINFSGGTINDAFKQFKDNWLEKSSDAFFSIWDEYVDKWEY